MAAADIRHLTSNRSKTGTFHGQAERQDCGDHGRNERDRIADRGSLRCRRCQNCDRGTASTGRRGAGEAARGQLHLPPDRRDGRSADAGADRARRGQVRPDRLPVQQCRRSGADRRHRGPRGRALRCGDGDAGAQRHARHEARRAHHEEAGVGQHHQQWQHRRPSRRVLVLDGLWGGQGGGDPSHQMRGDGARRVQCARQLDLARRDRNRYFRQGARAFDRCRGEDAGGDARGLQDRAADPARRPSRRHRPRRGVPGQRRIQLHQRPRPRRRRRHDRRPQLEPAAARLCGAA